MAYPSVISAISNPQANDRLNSPSHSSVHQAENTAITEIETFVGTLASTAGTLVYDIRSPLSNGGGHVQTAVLGGTGQTAYTKGDVLIASSGSVLSKLAVGLDGQALVANSSVATGVQWGTPSGSKIAASGVTTSIVVGPSAVETSVLSVSVPASIVTGTGVLYSKFFFKNIMVPTTSSLITKVLYGGTSIATFSSGPYPGFSVAGYIETTILGTGNNASVLGVVNFTGYSSAGSNGSVLTARIISNPVYADAGAAQTIGITERYLIDANGNQIDTAGYFIQKIV